MRLLWPALLLLHSVQVVGQAPATSGPLRFSGSVSAPLNQRQLLDRAIEAWRFSFGLEPGARMEVDTSTNSIIGAARFNFRSVQLNGREETQGPISYRIRVTTTNGECRWTIDDFKHMGNRGAPMGGRDLGPLTSDAKPPLRIPGMSYPATIKLWEDAKRQMTERLETVRRTFEARLRWTEGP